MIGQTLGHYQIVAKIGEGGMGEVYRARDTRLDRDVALKVLPEAFTSDPDRLARFEREAKLLASLNHPNIAAIHGLEEGGDTRALVLELVEGPTLADHIARGPIPVDEALPIARQIAEALEAAHEAGVIHRDLKPANIKVRKDGTVKVLDFGLAKAMAGEQIDQDLSQSPTVTATMGGTRDGVILGTAAYMSPEQARGKPVDKRTDIWAFGCVLFEMLTGQAAFAGETLSDTIGRVMEREPEWGLLPSTVPEAVRRLVRRSFVKDPRGRTPDAAVARIEIDEACQGRPEAGVPAVARPSFATAALTAFIAAMVAGVAVWFGMSGMMESVRETAVVSFDVPLISPEGNWSGGPLAFSSDGTMVAFPDGVDGVRMLHVRAIDAVEARPIRGTEGGTYPFFSPDGQWLGFRDGEALKRVALAGGPPETICLCRGFGATWGEDDTVFFGSDSLDAFLVPAEGGAPEPVSVPDLGQILVADPHWLPGNAAVLLTLRYGGAAEGADVAVLSPRTGEMRRITSGNNPHFVAPGEIVFAREDSIWVLPFDVETLEAAGSPRPALERIFLDEPGRAIFAASRGGELAFVKTTELGGDEPALLVDRSGEASALTGYPEGAAFSAPRVSPDGQTVAFQMNVEGNRDVWTYDFGRRSFERVTTADDWEGRVAWRPDGGGFAYTAGADRDLHLRLLDGSGTGQLLLEREFRQYPNDWTRDGSQLLFSEVHPERGYDILLLSVDDGTVTPVVLTEAAESGARLSPNNSWLAYESVSQGRSDVYVQSFPDPGEPVLVSSGGQRPVWSSDGRELFYRDGDRMMAVTVEQGSRFATGEPQVVFEGAYRFDTGSAVADYDVTPDGSTFIMLGLGELPSALQVIVNWASGLGRDGPPR